MKFVIGIISYLPDNIDLRNERVRRCRGILEQINQIFPELPVVVVAQNWRDEIDVEKLTVLKYDNALTISGARQILRDYLLNETDADYFILFDDDCVMQGTKTDGDEYLQTLSANPDKYYSCRNMFKLSAFSRKIFAENPLPTIGVHDKSGIEDMAYFKLLEANCKYCRIDKVCNLKEVSDWYSDNYSTWDREGLGDLIKITLEYIKQHSR